MREIRLVDIVEFFQPVPVDVAPSSALRGCNYGIFDGRTVFVSDAVMSLLKDEDVFEQTIRSLPIKHIPRPDLSRDVNVLLFNPGLGNANPTGQ